MKPFLILIICMILLSCSSADERLEMAKMSGGEVIHRTHPDSSNTIEYIIMVEGSKLKILTIFKSGHISKIQELPGIYHTEERKNR